MLRLRVRTLMVAVGVVALLLGSIGPGRRWYRRWTYHRSEAAVFARMEKIAQLDHARELRAAADRGSIRAGLMKTRGFVAQDIGEQDRIVENVVAFHRQRAGMSLAAAKQWAEKRRDRETAAFWCWDPYTPEVP